MKYILAKKLGMDQIWKNDAVVPVTCLQAGPVVITQIKSEEKDGYVGVQVGFGSKKKITKPMRGHFKNFGNFLHVKEFRLSDTMKDIPAEGSVLDVSVFEA